MPQSDVRSRRDRLRLASLRESLVTRLWPVPVAAIALAVVLGVVLPIVDEAVDEQLPPWLAGLLFSGAPDAARSVLSAIAGSLVSATTLTFSLTVVALQLASSQASPRVLRLFARDRVVQRTLAVFLGTFAFSLAVLRTVRDAGDESDAAVPRLAITLAFLCTVASVIMLVLFLAHLARQLRIETVMRDVRRETMGTVDLLRGEADASKDPGVAAPTRPEVASAVLATRSGFLTATDRGRLLAVAREHDLVVEEDRPVGTSIVTGTPIAFWWPRDPLRAATADDEVGEPVDEAVLEAFDIDYERTATQDVGFGLRQLVDIAARALSPGVNDPTTAVHALGYIAEVLSELARLPDQPAVLTDDDGLPRLIVRRHDFASFLEAGLQQLRHYGSGDPDVVARLYGVLREVGYACRRPEDHAAVLEQLARLETSVAEHRFDDVERARFAGFEKQVRQAVDGVWR